MHLTRIYIENNGPLEKIDLDFSGDPFRPVVLIGKNGSGKTNLLSVAADALFEAAALHYTNVVATQDSLNRPWFRTVGGVTVRGRAPGSVSILQFVHDGARGHFVERAGNLPMDVVKARVPPDLREQVTWAADSESAKEFRAGHLKPEKIFDSGAYVYLPSSRSEVPHWLNLASLPPDEFDLSARFSKHLRQPIYVERGMSSLKQWLAAVMLDSRVDFADARMETGDVIAVGTGETAYARTQRALLASINGIIRVLLDDPQATLSWSGRGMQPTLGVLIDRRTRFIGLEGLSAGQAMLFNLFGTLLRYSDQSPEMTSPNSARGICIVDEIDAHVHIDLQVKALPSLIKLFPNVQFLLSCHSPFFVLGMESMFGAEARFIEMPSGLTVDAEAYNEVAAALEALQGTRAFSESVVQSLTKEDSKVLVLLEGETDPEYLRTACVLLDRPDLLLRADFDWIGAYEGSSHAFNTGKDALNAVKSFVKANPGVIQRPLMLFYDNDTGKDPQDLGDLYVRAMPLVAGDAVVTKGVESYLDDQVFTDSMFDERTQNKGNGTTTVTRILKKVALCHEVCRVRRSADDVRNFGPVLDLVEEVVGLVDSKRPDSHMSEV